MMKESDFLSIMKENDSDKMKEFLLRFGKEPKIISPIYFETTLSTGGSNNGRERK